MTNQKKPKRSILRTAIILLVILGVVVTAIIFSFDRIASNALRSYYETTLVADVYALDFRRLNVNLITGNIKVRDVTFQKRAKPRNNYSYINSSVDLSAAMLLLENVNIKTLIMDKQLLVEKIMVIKPELFFDLNGQRNIFLPFPENEAPTPDSLQMGEKEIAIKTFQLSEFRLSDALVKISNSYQKNTYEAEGINIGFENFDFSIEHGQYKSRMGKIDVLIRAFHGNLNQGYAEEINFEDFTIQLDSVVSIASADTMLYRFRDFNSTISNLNVLTEDSLQNITMQQFDLSYRNRSIRIAEVNFEPNMSLAALQRKNEFQKVEASGSFKTLLLNQVNFDELIYKRRVIIESVVIDSLMAKLYKDRSKPLDPKRFPPYPPQGLANFKLPIHIGKISATNSLIEHNEKLEDGTVAHVLVNKASFTLENFNNLSTEGTMVLHGTGDLEKAARFDATLNFDYAQPNFDYYVSVAPFDLTRLNSLVNAFTPMRLSAGICDKLVMTGSAGNSQADGKLEFLYHDLKLDINLEEKANWKSTLLSFAGNAIVQSSNPNSEKSPARVVTYHIDRDMNKAFLNVIIKSVLEGLKETMFMGKENRKAHQDKKRLAKNDI